MNWDELIGKTRSLLKRHPPWSLELWEPKAEDLHGQAQRLSCTDLLLSVQGAHAPNMLLTLAPALTLALALALAPALALALDPSPSPNPSPNPTAE